MQNIINSEDLRYFMFDAGLHEDDIDFVQYSWNRKFFNKVREGDYFLYRRPIKKSENKKFYFFGTGRVGKITDHRELVTCTIKDPIRFKRIIYQDELYDYQWKWKTRKRDDFQQFFSNYGMNKIPYEDFIHFLELGVGKIDTKEFDQQNKDLVNSHIQLRDKTKGKLGGISKSSSRGSLGKIFSDNVRTIYNNKCCITGIASRSMLESSHISPWTKDVKNRGNERNGLLLSLILHKCFDKGLMSIDNNYKVIVSKNINDDVLKSYLDQFIGKKIKLPLRKEYHPDKNILEKHREEIFNK